MSKKNKSAAKDARHFAIRENQIALNEILKPWKGGPHKSKKGGRRGRIDKEWMEWENDNG